jgi:hypothetical protein
MRKAFITELIKQAYNHKLTILCRIGWFTASVICFIYLIAGLSVDIEWLQRLDLTLLAILVLLWVFSWAGTMAFALLGCIWEVYRWDNKEGLKVVQ